MVCPSLKKTIRILLIDDHRIVRAGLRMLIENQPELSVVGEAGSGEEALAIADREQPDIILLDLDLGGRDSLEFLPQLTTAAPEARVIVLTGLRDSDEHRRAIRLGASGIVLKDQACELLIKAIAKVHAGEAWIDRS